jgi:hypothetical protein
VGSAVLAAAGTVAARAWIGGWDGAPDLGLATYLFWPMLVGGAVLVGCAARLSAADPATETSDGPVRPG